MPKGKVQSSLVKNDRRDVFYRKENNRKSSIQMWDVVILLLFYVCIFVNAPLWDLCPG